MSKALLLIFAITLSGAQAAQPAITVVTGDNAPALEKLAAKEVSGMLHALFDAETKHHSGLPADASPAVLVGSPGTNPAIAALGEAFWPKLSDQGHLLKSARVGGRDVLVVGGGSPPATLWAAYELGYRFGIRPLLNGDALPVQKPAFHLDGFAVVLEPNLRVRAWSAFTGIASGAESWALEDHRRLLAQLARLKFTHVVLTSQPWQPFPGSNGAAVPGLWRDGQLRVDGDTAGRAAFKGAKFFENSSFAGAADSSALAKAAAALAAGIEAGAAPLGITVTTEAPQNARPLSLGAPKASVLPEFSFRKLSTDLGAIRRARADGFTARAVMPGDLDAAAHFVSRASFDDKLTPEGALEDLVTPICGEGVAERMLKGFAMIEQAAKLIADNDPAVAVPDPQFLMRHEASKEAPPAWWNKAKDLYLQAMNEMYRANTRARDGARPFILHHAKRMEFAMQYFATLDALRKAGNARAAGNATARAEALEQAVEALYNGLNAFADVVRDQSERGAIALLNAHGYHPLLRKLDELGK